MVAHAVILPPYVTAVSQSYDKSETLSPKRSRPNYYNLSWRIHLAASPNSADCSQFSSQSPGFQDKGLVCSFPDKFFSVVQLKDDTRSHKCLLEMKIASRSRSRNMQAMQLGLLADCKCTEDTKHQSCKFSEKIFLTLISILLQSKIWKEMVEVSWLRQLSLTCWIKL